MHPEPAFFYTRIPVPSYSRNSVILFRIHIIRRFVLFRTIQQSTWQICFSIFNLPEDIQPNRRKPKQALHLVFLSFKMYVNYEFSFWNCLYSTG